MSVGRGSPSKHFEMFFNALHSIPPALCPSLNLVLDDLLNLIEVLIKLTTIQTFQLLHDLVLDSLPLELFALFICYYRFLSPWCINFPCIRSLVALCLALLALRPLIWMRL